MGPRLLAEHLKEQRVVDEVVIKSFLAEIADPTPEYWPRLYMSLWYLSGSTGLQGRERAIYPLLHPALATTGQAYLPVLLTTYDGSRFTALFRLQKNTRLAGAILRSSPYDAMQSLNTLPFTYLVKLKSKSYQYHFVWNFEQGTRHSFTVRQTLGEEEKLLPIFELSPRLNAVSGFLYTYAQWVQRTRLRLPGWRKENCISGPKRAGDHCSRLVRRNGVGSRIHKHNNGHGPNSVAVSIVHNEPTLSAAKWLERKLKIST